MLNFSLGPKEEIWILSILLIYCVILSSRCLSLSFRDPFCLPRSLFLVIYTIVSGLGLSCTGDPHLPNPSPCSEPGSFQNISFIQGHRLGKWEVSINIYGINK